MQEREEFQTLLSSADNLGLGDFEGGKNQPNNYKAIKYTHQEGVSPQAACRSS